MNRRTAAFLAVLVLVSICNRSSGKALLQGDRIVIVGERNSLASVAADIADSEIFDFDPERDVALANRNIVIKGILLVGSNETPGDSLARFQMLEMNVSRCGAVRIDITASPGEVGELHLRRAKVTAIHETDDKCSDPNLLIVAGKLIAHNSELSGNIQCLVSPTGFVELVGSTISYTQNAALVCELKEPQRLDIRNSAFIDNANYGIHIASSSDVLEIRDSVFRGLAADVFHAGSGEVVLTDCDFRTVRFGSLPGKVVRKWTTTLEVPRGGLHVVATSARDNPQRETVRGISDENGLCRLALTEYVAFPPRAQEFQEGVNNATPHEICVYDADGKTLLYKIENFHVFMKGQKATLR